MGWTGKTKISNRKTSLLAQIHELKGRFNKFEEEVDMFNPSPSTWKWRSWYWFQMTCKLKQLHEDNLDTINCHSSPFWINSRTRKLGWLMLKCYLKWMTDECWIQQNVSHDLAIRAWKHKAKTTSAQRSQQFRPLNRQSAVDNTAFF